MPKNFQNSIKSRNIWLKSKQKNGSLFIYIKRSIQSCEVIDSVYPIANIQFKCNWEWNWTVCNCQIHLNLYIFCYWHTKRTTQRFAHLVCLMCIYSLQIWIFWTNQFRTDILFNNKLTHISMSSFGMNSEIFGWWHFL